VFLAGRGGSERGTRLASAVVRAAAAHQRDGLPLRLLRQHRAPKRLGVLHDVVIARKGRRCQSADDDAGEQQSCVHAQSAGHAGNKILHVQKSQSHPSPFGQAMGLAFAVCQTVSTIGSMINDQSHYRRGIVFLHGLAGVVITAAAFL